MNKSDYIINLLLKENGLPAKMKSLQGNFDALNKSVKAVNESVSVFSANLVQSLDAAGSLSGVASAHEQLATQVNTAADGIERLQTVVDNAKTALFEETGGLSASTLALGEQAGAINELVTLYQTLKTVNLQATAAAISSAAATAASTVAQKASAVATRVMTVAQNLLNGAMRANVIGLIITGLTTLAAGVMTAYDQFAGFREVVDKAWAGIKKLGAVIWDGLVGAFEGLASVLTPIWNKLSSLLGLQEKSSQSTQQAASATSSYSEATAEAAENAATLNSALEIQNQKQQLNLDTLGGVSQKISELRGKQENASTEQAIAIEKEIRLLEEKKRAMENSIMIGAVQVPEMSALPTPDLKGLEVKPINIPLEINNKEMDACVKRVQQKAEKLKEFAFDIGKQTTEVLQKSITKLAEALGESLVSGDWGATFKSLLISLMDMLSQFGAALIAAGLASLAFKSVLHNPILAVIAGTALVVATSVAKAALQSATKMANGGIVYGPTYAQVGEYPGAANNPEVVAPLNKLRSLIQPANSFEGGQVEFVIKGQRLVGVLNKESNKGRFF